jgi:hypothetical protein
VAANHAHSLIRRSRHEIPLYILLQGHGSRTESEMCCSQLPQCSCSYGTYPASTRASPKRRCRSVHGKAMVVMVRQLINVKHRIGQMSECCRPQTNFCTLFPKSGYIHFWKYRVQNSRRWGRSAIVEDDRQAQEGLRNAPVLRASASL